MKAIFITGGKQYYVSVGDEIYVERLKELDGSVIDFTEVFSVGDKIGSPFVLGAKVTCEVVKNGLKKKLYIFKYHPKKKYRLKKGHRQPYTKLLVKDIVG